MGSTTEGQLYGTRWGFWDTIRRATKEPPNKNEEHKDGEEINKKRPAILFHRDARSALSPGRYWENRAEKRRMCWALGARASVEKPGPLCSVAGKPRDSYTADSSFLPREEGHCGAEAVGTVQPKLYLTCEKCIFTSATCPCSRRKLLMQ